VRQFKQYRVDNTMQFDERGAAWDYQLPK